MQIGGGAKISVHRNLGGQNVKASVGAHDVRVGINAVHEFRGGW